MSNGRCDGVTGYQTRFALAALGIDGPEQSDIKSRYLVQKDDQDQAARDDADATERVPADAEAGRIWPEA
jgi:hypothetical protein